MRKRSMSSIGAVIAVLFLGGGTVAFAADGPGFGVDPVGPPRDPIFGVENSKYPGAAQIAAETNILLKSGDGNILYTKCSNDPKLLVVRSSMFDSMICFQPVADVGWLTMEIPGSYLVKATDQSKVKVTSTTSNDETSVVTLEKNQLKNIEVANQEVTVVELRLNG